MRTLSIACLCLLAACTRKKEPSVLPATAIIAIDDRTDPILLHPEAEALLSLYGFAILPEQAASLQLVLITDMKLNPTQTISLPTAAESEKENTREDITYRERIIGSFQDAVRKAVRDFPTRYQADTCAQSECYATIAAAIDELASNTASQKIAVVFSNLQENQEDFSCYTDEGQEMLRTNPDKVARLMQRRHPLPKNLTGVTVYFVFQPHTPEEDAQFATMVALYTKLLKSRGARVVVQATNTQFQP
jgi:hypothetical protein